MGTAPSEARARPVESDRRPPAKSPRWIRPGWSGCSSPSPDRRAFRARLRLWGLPRPRRALDRWSPPVGVLADRVGMLLEPDRALAGLGQSRRAEPHDLDEDQFLRLRVADSADPDVAHPGRVVLELVNVARLQRVPLVDQQDVVIAPDRDAVPQAGL